MNTHIYFWEIDMKLTPHMLMMFWFALKVMEVVRKRQHGTLMVSYMLCVVAILPLPGWRLERVPAELPRNSMHLVSNFRFLTRGSCITLIFFLLMYRYSFEHYVFKLCFRFFVRRSRWFHRFPVRIVSIIISFEMTRHPWRLTPITMGANTWFSNSNFSLWM